jgi:hypothetical protein
VGSAKVSQSLPKATITFDYLTPLAGKVSLPAWLPYGNFFKKGGIDDTNANTASIAFGEAA